VVGGTSVGVAVVGRGVSVGTMVTVGILVGGNGLEESLCVLVTTTFRGEFAVAVVEDVNVYVAVSVDVNVAVKVGVDVGNSINVGPKNMALMVKAAAVFIPLISGSSVTNASTSAAVGGVGSKKAIA
jgi:hypothetical protein